MKWSYEDRKEADKCANSLELMWTNVRLFDSAGHIIKEGVTTSQAFNIASKIRFIERRYMLDEKEA